MQLQNENFEISNTPKSHIC